MLRHKPETPFGAQKPYLEFLEDRCHFLEPLLAYCGPGETDL